MTDEELEKMGEAFYGCLWKNVDNSVKIRFKAGVKGAQSLVQGKYEFVEMANGDKVIMIPEEFFHNWEGAIQNLKIFLGEK